ncbi:DUF4381 domain-containing protein [Shewanella fidelis]|uniref:DUF4381 domain-containing protein n=1 Tax=Shewanella fidelis TaxID=173509 RepID=A0AAW8NJ62_9GAMM|nr:DUF4381 domain-containing protein [Shewanella fidelis]MDR8523343.1 DUF4381 domain-containing protein [Shewanella fidelis]MDW4811331.1 DUF4381 domain-containing protein [Shewanella fidelis]MDW4815452.1 DUF4381 domain-containing protein [Shewanella fidelis]MDW4819542.1 DUF4381 domain-containing protein [Shewanella fidelis]MDW4824484.1 DUF4381 domain-containing protein [Shewanella fidelis]
MTTQANPALAALQDIQTPVEIGAWPLAYGYWITLALIICSLGLITYWLIKRRQTHAAKNAALAELAALELQHEQFVDQVSSILKRAALSYSPRTQVAQLSGDNWYKWLNAQVSSPQNELCELLAKRFQANPFSDAEKSKLRASAQRWIKSALPLKKAAKSEESTC